MGGFACSFPPMVSKLDDSVGAIVAQLQHRNMLRNSIIVFSTDNGGPAEGFNLNHASNWPLRGVKNTLWEGGIRGAGLLWSPRLKNVRRVSHQTFHIVDWLPTLMHAIGAPIENTTGKLDGMSIWDALSTNSASPRVSTLHNIDDIWGSSAITVFDWKVVKGTNYAGAWDGWYGPAGTRAEAAYNYSAVQRSSVGKALSALNMMPTKLEMTKLRRAASVNCPKNQSHPDVVACAPLDAPCLFNIRDDPCERYNMAEWNPTILDAILKELDDYNSTAIPPGNKPVDKRADPRFWDNTWTNFGDFEIEVTN